MTKAMYAFSGDPITYGHINIVERAARAFDKVVVGIGVNPDKKYTFTLEERLDMASKVLKRIKNVEVVSYEGLLVHYAYENGIGTVVKGVRENKDFDYEEVLHQVGESQKLGIDTHILFAQPELAHVSSSTVKAVQKEQGLIHEFVPLYVKQCLEAKISSQYIISVTGEIGCGKSYVGNMFVELGKKKGLKVHNIDLDRIGHDVLGKLKEPRYLEIRKKVADRFGKSILLPDGTISRKDLGNIVFNDIDKLKELNEIMHQPILVRLRKELRDKKGWILINAALIAETGIGYLSNNNVILVHANKKSGKRRLKENRGLTDEQIERRLENQYSYEMKKQKLEEATVRDMQGKIYLLENSDGASEKEIEDVFERVVSDLRIK